MATLRNHRPKAGISEVVAAVLTIAITLIAGAALFGYVNGQAASNENAIGNAYASNVNFLQEKFVVAQASFTPISTNPGTITVYIYNSGQVQNHFVQVEVWTSPRSSMDLLYNETMVYDLNNPTCHSSGSSVESKALGMGPGSFEVNASKVAQIALTLPSCFSGNFLPGSVYYLKILGAYGNVVTYFQGD